MLQVISEISALQLFQDTPYQIAHFSILFCSAYSISWNYTRTVDQKQKFHALFSNRNHYWIFREQLPTARNVVRPSRRLRKSSGKSTATCFHVKRTINSDSPIQPSAPSVNDYVFLLKSFGVDPLLHDQAPIP